MLNGFNHKPIIRSIVCERKRQAGGGASKGQNALAGTHSSFNIVIKSAPVIKLTALRKTDNVICARSRSRIRFLPLNIPLARDAGPGDVTEHCTMGYVPRYRQSAQREAGRARGGWEANKSDLSMKNSICVSVVKRAGSDRGQKATFAMMRFLRTAYIVFKSFKKDRERIGEYIAFFFLFFFLLFSSQLFQR